MSEPHIEIDAIYGNCPVQADGKINGQPFYFRARGEHWSIGIGKDPIGDPDWEWVGPWGDAPFEAGWMEPDVARQLIGYAATAYHKETSC